MSQKVQLALHFSRRFPGVQNQENQLLQALTGHWREVAKKQQNSLSPHEKLEALIHQEEVVLLYETFPPQLKEKALYLKGKTQFKKGVIIVNKNTTNQEKAALLAEELAHHHYTDGNILDQSSLPQQKQEHLARNRAYQKLLPPQTIVQALQQGCTTLQDLADFTGHQPLFVKVVLDLYQQKNLLPPSYQNLLVS